MWLSSLAKYINVDFDVSHPIMMIAVIATFFWCDMPPLNIYHTTLFRELQTHIKSHTVVRQNMIILAHFAVVTLELICSVL